ncbi:unnamed protein product [Malus baccata var. baccata]
MATCLPFRAIPLKPHFTRPAKITCSAPTAQSQLAKQRLLNLIGDQDRGLMTQNNPTKLASIVKAIDDLADLGRDSVTTGGSLSATWRLLWTTEKEQLFIIQKASLFGTQTGDVLQVIDVGQRVLNNVITFPPDGVFFVRSDIAIASNQRVNFNSKREKLGNSIAAVRAGLVSALFSDVKKIPSRYCFAWLNLLSQGSYAPDSSILFIVLYTWFIPEDSSCLLKKTAGSTLEFDTVYLDDEIRVVKDIRGDYLVVDRAPYTWKE